MTERLRIAHLTAVYPPYAAGGGVACAYQAAELARRGHDVTVHTVRLPGPPPPSPARIVRHRAVLQLGAAPLLPGLWRLPEVDVLHVHHPFIFGVEPVLAHLARHRRTPLVVGYHNRLVGDGARRALFFGYEETLGRALARRADRLCVLSAAHADTVSYLRSARRRRPERLAVVPNGVDAERFSPGPPRAEDGTFVVVHVATLDRTHHLKRTDVALEAVARVPDERVRLLVVGDGDWRGRLQDSPAARQLGERVRFLGGRDHDALPEVLRTGDAFLLSSDMDAFPLVLLEALACGLPAVATDPPGVRAMVAGSDAALLAPAGDPAALAAALGRLAAASTEERARRGAAARALVEERYALPVVVDALEDVYREALVQRGHAMPLA